MEPNLIKKYMQSIEDFVFIEDKIVTYLWLCQILKVHVNTAKQLLHVFATKEDVKNRVLITYVLGGELKNGKGRLLKLVIGDTKEAVKQLFSKITTDHIFSIQRSGGSFSSTDVFNSFPHFSVLPETRRFCPIRPIKEIKKREINYITEAKNFLNPSLPVKKQIVPKETESSKKEIKNGESSKPSKSENSTDSSEPPAKQKKTSGNEKDLKSKGGDIGSFFSRQAEKKSSEQLGSKGKSETKEEKAKGGIGAFFKRENKTDISTKEVKEKETTIKSEANKENETKEVPEAKKQNGVKEPVNAPTKDKKQKSKEGKRKRKKKDDDGMEKKRRKRIVSALSSDSESSGNETSDCEMEVEPEQPPPMEQPPVVEEDEDMIPPTPGRKRVRKQIDKVSMDEDGFIITKKEFVYESCSDDEAKDEKKENKDINTKEDKTVQKTPLKKNEVSPNNAKQNKSPNNDKSNKQSAITNFFKRKAVT